LALSQALNVTNINESLCEGRDRYAKAQTAAAPDKKKRGNPMNKHHFQYDTIKPVATLDDFPKIKGYDYEKNMTEGFDLQAFFASWKTTGFQATNLSRAADIIEQMRQDQATIFLSFTSNMISSGVREAITFLAKHNHVQCIVTTAGGIEEDVIKLLKPFVLGTFEAPGEQLFNSGVNRTGNIFVPNDRFALYDIFMQKFLPQLHEKHKGKSIPTHVFIRELGLAIADLDNKEESYLYWAAQHNIPVICPALMDGSTGDLIHFFRQTNKEFTIDVTQDLDLVVKLALNAEKTGAIILGAGTAKHYVLNANIFHEGLDYAVYINTAEEYDGSDSGARIDEAITWGKIKIRVPSIKVHCDATIAFPLLMAMTFARKKTTE